MTSFLSERHVCENNFNFGFVTSHPFIYFPVLVSRTVRTEAENNKRLKEKVMLHSNTAFAGVHATATHQVCCPQGGRRKRAADFQDDPRSSSGAF